MVEELFDSVSTSDAISVEEYLALCRSCGVEVISHNKLVCQVSGQHRERVEALADPNGQITKHDFIQHVKVEGSTLINLIHN